MFEHTEKTYTYIILGNPVPLARPRFNGRRVWDSQSQLKLAVGIDLARQHDNLPLLELPVSIKATFFMPMPAARKVRERIRGSYHHYKPDIDNLIKFVLDVCNGVIIKDDSQVCAISASKIYDEVPRTVFTLLELK